MDCDQYTCVFLSEVRTRDGHEIHTQYWCRRYSRRLFKIDNRVKRCVECREANDERED